MGAGQSDARRGRRGVSCVEHGGPARPPPPTFYLLRRPLLPNQVGELMGVEGAPEALVSLLDEAPTDLATEVAWVLTYVTGGSWRTCSH